MTIHYLLTPIKQPTPKVCFQTALWILDRYQRGKRAIPTVSDLSTRFESGVNVRNMMMLNKEEALKFADRYGFASEYVGTSPDAFLSALRSRGPFAYIGDLPNDRPYQHTIVITGVKTQKHHLYTLSYIDPWHGRENRDEFYNVLRKYLPF